jgi:hypothetical protein
VWFVCFNCVCRGMGTEMRSVGDAFWATASGAPARVGVSRNGCACAHAHTAPAVTAAAAVTASAQVALLLDSGGVLAALQQWLAQLPCSGILALGCPKACADHHSKEKSPTAPHQMVDPCTQACVSQLQLQSAL